MSAQAEQPQHCLNLINYSQTHTQTCDKVYALESILQITNKIQCRTVSTK